jgi:hypothetical protein
VLSVSGVLDAYCTENDTNGPVTIGGVQLVPNSLYVAATGGSAQAIAQAIWSKKAPGCAYNGNTTVTVYDQNSGYSPPFPSYNVSFQIPYELNLLFSVAIKNGPNVPSNADALVQNAIVGAAAAGTAPAASIGSTVYALAYANAITALGTWAQLISIEIGSNNSPACVANGSISGTTLHITSIISGSLADGQTISSGSGVSGTAGASGTAITIGTQILNQVSGTVGGVGFYTINNSQNVGPGVITAAIANTDLVVVQINQEPVIVAPNISLTLV